MADRQGGENGFAYYAPAKPKPDNILQPPGRAALCVRTPIPVPSGLRAAKFFPAGTHAEFTLLPA